MATSPNSPGSKWTRIRWLFALILILVTVLVGWGAHRYVRYTLPESIFQAGKEAFARGDLETVQGAAEALKGKPGYEPHMHLLRGMVLLRLDQLEEAIRECGHAREHPDTRALAHALSGEALSRAGYYRDADRVLTLAVQMDPDLTDARRWLAATYYDLGAMHQAVEQLEVVAQQAPQDPRPHRLMGLIDKDYQKYGRAVDRYRESLRRDPDQPARHEIALELASCLVQLRRFDEALDALKGAPATAEVQALRAESHYGLGDQAAARTAVTEALQQDANNLSALLVRARIQMDEGDATSAVETLKQAVQFFPKEWRLRHQLSTAYRRLGQMDLAEEQVKATQELRELRERFAKLHEQAMANPADPEVRYQLGMMALELDMPELAQTWLQATLGLDYQHVGARAALAALHTPNAP